MTTFCFDFFIVNSSSFALKTPPDRFDEILQMRLFSVSAQLLLRLEGVRTPPAPETYSRTEDKESSLNL